MIVPVDALSRVPLDVFARLGDKLRALELGAARDEVRAVGAGVPLELRAPLRRRALRARHDDAAIALRLFCFDDAVPADDLARALGAIVTGALLGAGVLVRHASAGVRSLVPITPLEHLLVASDPLSPEPDAVMGVGSTTIALCRASSGKRLGRVLDVGTGAGTVALYLARDATHVVGTEVNPRAAPFFALNAAMNAITNVELRLGDLFAPVAGERFDLVVSQPPFVARPEGSERAIHLHGGARGDELALRLLRELPPFLADGGLAFVLASHPGTELASALREALGPDRGLTSLEVRGDSLDELAAGYENRGDGFDEGYARRMQQALAHLEALSIRAVTQSLTIIGDGSHTTSLKLGSARIARLDGAGARARFAAGALLAGDDRTLLRAGLQLVPGLSLERSWGDKGRPPRLALEHPTDPTVTRTEMTAPTLELLREIDRANDVGTAMAWVSARHKVPRDKTLPTLLPVVRDALRQGVLRVRA